MRDHTRWVRKPFEVPGEVSLLVSDPGRRAAADEETRRDLQKPIQQLICDVHEGAMDRGLPYEERYLWAVRRMVSMMGRVVLEHERLSRTVVWLNWVILALTVVVAILGALSLYVDWNKK